MGASSEVHFEERALPAPIIYGDGWVSIPVMPREFYEKNVNVKLD
jgi:hypothetical protein